MKTLRIVNSILLAIICLIECFAIYVLVESLIPLIAGNAGGILAVFLALLPIYIITVVAIIILTIALSITTNLLNKKMMANNIQTSKFNKVCKILPWVFILFDIVMLVIIFIIGNAK